MGDNVSKSLIRYFDGRLVQPESYKGEIFLKYW